MLLGPRNVASSIRSLAPLLTLTAKPKTQAKCNQFSTNRLPGNNTFLSGASERFRGDFEAVRNRNRDQNQPKCASGLRCYFFFLVLLCEWEREWEGDRARDKEGAAASATRSWIYHSVLGREERFETKKKRFGTKRDETSRIETKRNESNQNRTFLGAIGARTSPWRTETRWPLTEWQRSPENRFRFGIWIGELLFKRSVSHRIVLTENRWNS